MLDEALSDLGAAGSILRLLDLMGLTHHLLFLSLTELKAVALVYAGNKSSYHLKFFVFNLNGDLTTGPKHVFSLSAGDVTNGLYKIIGNNGDQIIVHNSFIADAEVGDKRVTDKTIVRSDPTAGRFKWDTPTKLYATNISPIDIIRNEELILLYAKLIFLLILLNYKSFEYL